MRSYEEFFLISDSIALFSLDCFSIFVSKSAIFSRVSYASIFKDSILILIKAITVISPMYNIFSILVSLTITLRLTVLGCLSGRVDGCDSGICCSAPLYGWYIFSTATQYSLLILIFLLRVTSHYVLGYFLLNLHL